MRVSVKVEVEAMTGPGAEEMADLSEAVDAEIEDEMTAAEEYLRAAVADGRNEAVVCMAMLMHADRRLCDLGIGCERMDAPETLN